MKKTILLLLIVAMTFSCASMTRREFEPNLEGKNLTMNGQVDTETLKNSVWKALNYYKWEIVEMSDFHAEAQIVKNNGIKVIILIEWDNEGYVIRYVDSEKLDYKDDPPRIHRTYVRWINSLDNAIFKFYNEA